MKALTANLPNTNATAAMAARMRTRLAAVGIALLLSALP